MEDQFEAIKNSLCSSNEGVEPGPMMSAAGIKYKGKVFAFFHEDAMTFKLGKEFRPEDYDIDEWEWLSPFKNKPPMKGWWGISPKHADQWEMLAQMALDKMRD